MVKEIIIEIIKAAVPFVMVWIFCSMLPKIKKTVKTAMLKHKKKRMMEKNAVPLGGMPIFTSPNGYLYTVSDDKKSIFCADCYASNSKLIPLEKTGRKKYACPSCNKEYKV
jgi:hypothetical protein